MMTESLLIKLSHKIEERMGLHFSSDRLKDLGDRLKVAACEFSFDNENRFAEWLISAPLSKEQIESLALHLTVGETYFYREKQSFDHLETRILPALIQSREKTGRFLRIWSAGCASGEEPYTIAMLLDKMIPDIKDWHISILATDINPGFIQKAAKGIYTDWSFRSTPSWVKQKHFTRIGNNRFQISPRIKQMVNFSYLNLVEDEFPSLLYKTNAMDLVFCRNVMIYFVDKTARDIINRMFHTLVNDGWLIVSPVETALVKHSRLQVVQVQGATLFQKSREERRPDWSAKHSAHIIQAEAPTRSVKIKPSLKPDSRKVRIKKPPVPAETARSTATDFESLYNTGLEHVKKNAYVEAIELLLPRLQGIGVEKVNSSLTAKLMALLSRSYANLGTLDEALKWSDKSIKHEKVNPAYYHLQAGILMELDRLGEAIQTLQKAIYLDPDFIVAHFTLGNIYRLNGKRDKSEKYFRNTLSLLNGQEEDHIIFESEGLSVDKLKRIVTTFLNGNK